MGWELIVSYLSICGYKYFFETFIKKKRLDIFFGDKMKCNLNSIAAIYYLSVKILEIQDISKNGKTTNADELSISFSNPIKPIQNQVMYKKRG